MAELVADCPRCGANDHTFIVLQFLPAGVTYSWKQHFETFSVCKNCFRSTVFQTSQKNINDNDLIQDSKELMKYQGSINQIMDVDGYVNLRNATPVPAPRFTPDNIAAIYLEATESVKGNCPNAAAAMFRLCIDLVTKGLLPAEASQDASPESKAGEPDPAGLNRNVRTKLAARLEWLFKTSRLPTDLEELSHCIREDGNDGAHDGTLALEDAENLQDFTYLLLERIFTEPGRLLEAKARRLVRNKQ